MKSIKNSEKRKRKRENNQDKLHEMKEDLAFFF